MNDPNRKWLSIAIVAVVVVFAACTCCVCIGASYFYWVKGINQDTPIPTLAPTTPVATLDPDSEQSVITPVAPVLSDIEQTLLALEQADLPVSDLHDLAVRFRDVPADTSRVVTNISPNYEIGTVRTFEAANLDSETSFTLKAELVYKTEHVYMWVQQGLPVNESRLRKAADLFERQTYPTNRDFFGSEWTPGVDGDPHLSVLHATNLGQTVAGYFSSADSFVKVVRSDSNEMEMFYININGGMEVGDPFYNGVLAHEFQHMIHWNNDRNEATWLNEGCAELAMDLNYRLDPAGAGNYDTGGSEYSYLDNPDTQLNSWPENDITSGAAANYGASYLFMAYFLDRFGDEATKALVSHPENSLESVDRVLLNDLSFNISHEYVFADWIIANLVDDPELSSGEFGYKSIDVDTPLLDESFGGFLGLPASRNSEVHQYAVDYIEVRSKSPVTFTFAGDTYANIMSNEAHSGAYLWWSNRGDESDARLTRTIDLREASSAEISFWLWYEIEEDWDYAYVVVGETSSGVLPDDLNSPSINWTILHDASLGCTLKNPNKSNLGCGITGDSNGWRQVKADLTGFTGKEIALRLEYITDAVANLSGMALDDTQLIIDDEVIFTDDSETLDSLWISEGFVRHANQIPQQWIIQLVTYDDIVAVERLIMLDTVNGAWTIPLNHTRDRAVIAISAIAPFTTETAAYSYSLETE